MAGPVRHAASTDVGSVGALLGDLLVVGGLETFGEDAGELENLIVDAGG